MLRHLVALCIAVSATLPMTTTPLSAQSTSSLEAERAAVLSEIRTNVIRTIGAQDQTVEVTVAGPLLIVLRVNSNMNESTHAGRDNEATAIASIASKAVAGKPAFKDVISLQVRYVVRSASGVDKVIDTVEFREDPSGVFQHHQT
jgi:hypothetical protein